MLIVLSGIDSIHKKFFSREIVSTLNVFTHDGHTIDFTGANVKIYNQAGERVFQLPDSEHPGGINTLLINKKDGSSNEVGKKLLEEVVALQNSMFDNPSRIDHFDYVFCNPLYDLGVVPEFFYQNDLQSYNYETDIIENYNNRKYENYVITGVFSKTYIEKLKEDLGADNVTVINIIRNPSAAFLLHEKEASHYMSNPRTPEVDHKKLEMSLLNAVILKDVPGVITLKFEDIINDGKLTLLGKDVVVPPDHNKAGTHLTWWEADYIVSKKVVNPKNLEAFNTKFSAFEPLTNVKYFTDASKQQEYLDAFNSKNGSNITLEDAIALLSENPKLEDRRVKDCLPFFNAANKSNVTAEQLDELFPINIFDKLGYTPKTYDEVVKLN